MASIRTHVPALALILAVGFLSRLTWIAFVEPPAYDEHLDDTIFYRGAAHFIAQGQGYINPFFGTPTAEWPPGYPAFLGGVYKLFGEGSAQTSWANLALMLLAMALMYAIGVMLFDRPAALIATAAVAVWPGQIYFTSLALSEPLFTTLLLAAVLLLVLIPRIERLHASALVAFALITAAATLTRGEGLLLLPLALLSWRLLGLRWPQALRFTAVAAICTGAVLSVWAVRNERQLGSYVLTSSFGSNLWVGHHASATGRLDVVGIAPPTLDRPDLPHGEFEVASDRLRLREALRYMRTHPVDELRLSGIKVRELYRSDDDALDYNSVHRSSRSYPRSLEPWLRALGDAFWYLMLALAGIGLIFRRIEHSAGVGMLLAVIALWTAAHVVFFGGARYHYPIVFAIALLGARGLLLIGEQLRDTVRRQSDGPRAHPRSIELESGDDGS